MRENRLSIKNENVLPFSYDNFSSIIDAYFIKNGIVNPGPQGIDNIFLRAMNQLNIAEFDFLIRTVYKKLDYFKDRLSPNGLTISNLCTYALDAYLGVSVGDSSNRGKISNDFRKILKLEILKYNF